jgi:hypothetical protein
MINPTVTFFKGLRNTKPEANFELKDIFENIKTGKWKTEVLACREDLSKKDKLPCFTPTGIFNHRSIKGLEQYNGIICLDIDGVANPEDLKELCKNLHWVTAAFITPSGQGLKVFVQTQGTVENYKQTEELVASAFLEATGVARDNRCKDIARIQFVSYDENLYHNPYALTF